MVHKNYLKTFILEAQSNKKIIKLLTTKKFYGVLKKYKEPLGHILQKKYI